MSRHESTDTENTIVTIHCSESTAEQFMRFAQERNVTPGFALQILLNASTTLETLLKKTNRTTVKKSK